MPVIIVSAQSKELGFGVFQTWSDLLVRIWGLLGQGIGDLDSGLTIDRIICLAYFVPEAFDQYCKSESKSPIPCPNRPQILTLRSDQV